MKFCPHCAKELSMQTAFCPNCGKSINGSNHFLNLPKNFWMTFIGALPLIIMSMLTWATIPATGYFAERAISLNIYSLWSLSNDLSNFLGLFDAQSQEIMIFKAIATIMLIVLMLSFLLLVVSLVKYRSKVRARIAYWGFGLNAIVSVFFIIALLIVNIQVEKASMGFISSAISLTPFPYMTLTIAIVAMLFLVKRPVLIRLNQRSAIKGAIIGMSVGTALMMLFGALTNYFILLPLYFGTNVSAGLEGALKNRSVINDMGSYITLAVLPFNFIKGALISAATLLIYKKVAPVLHGVWKRVKNERNEAR